MCRYYETNGTKSNRFLLLPVAGIVQNRFNGITDEFSLVFYFLKRETMYDKKWIFYIL